MLLPEEPITFSSPGYPQKYPANLDCRWEIRSSGNPVILVEIDHFKTETSADVVSFEGRTFHGDLSSVFTISGSTKIRAIIFNSSLVFVTFKSDSNKEYSGFLLSLQGNFSLIGKDNSKNYNHFFLSMLDVCNS